jgi:hypothetical protein
MAQGKEKIKKKEAYRGSYKSNTNHTHKDRGFTIFTVGGKVVADGYRERKKKEASCRS